MRWKDWVLLAFGVLSCTGMSVGAEEPNKCKKRWLDKLVALDFRHLIDDSQLKSHGIAYMLDAEKIGKNPLHLKKGYHFSFGPQLYASVVRSVL